MARAYVGIGSNIEPAHNVPAALHALARRTRVVAISTFYRTAPIGHPDDPPFVNGVVAIETELAPNALVRVLHAIEDELGRRRGPDRNAPRTIDLDLLLHGTDGPSDPDITTRAFVAWPLVELDPALVLPGGAAVQAIAERLPRTGMVALPELTAELRGSSRVD